MDDLKGYEAGLIRDRAKALELHATQIGRMCVLWSGLEQDIMLFLAAISKLDDPLDKNIFLAALDMRAKLDCVLLIAHKRKPSEKWMARLTSVINAIDNQIRVERNRTIHDFWNFIPDDAGVLTLNRVQFKPKVRKEPPSGTPVFTLAEFKAVTPEEISALCEQIIDANVEINQLSREFSLKPSRGKSGQLYRTQNPRQDNKP